jgi:hypothetical protein
MLAEEAAYFATEMIMKQLIATAVTCTLTEKHIGDSASLRSGSITVDDQDFEDSMARRIQQCWRGTRGRKLARKLFVGTYLKHVDHYGNQYYYNSITATSQWERPRLYKRLYPNTVSTF